MASLIKILDNAKFLSKTVFGDVSPNPTYQLGSSLASVNEGSSVTFTLSTTNISDGTLVPYVITGVSLADLASGALTGNFTVASGLASASITLAADALTEGSETMTVSLSSGVASASVVVNDTSRTPTYAIGRSLSAVNEGSSVVFTLSTTNVSNGTVLPYTISGISSNDVTTGSLTGSFTVSNNLATATITMSADQLTEGAETATLTLNNAAASNFVVVNDTSVFTPATISGLQLWLDAADSSTLFDATAGGNLVATDGTAVARWADKSGNNRHATQGTANARPLLKTSVKNGRNVLRFDGANDKIIIPNSAGAFSFAYTSPFAIFVVCKNDGTTNTYNFWAIADNGITGGNRGFYFGQSGSGNNKSAGFSLYNSWNAPVIENGSSALIPRTQFSLASFLLNPTAPVAADRSSGFVNGANQFNNNTRTLTPTAGNTVENLTIGGQASFSTQAQFIGDISEILIYNSALTTTQRQAVETYLNSKWALY